MISTKHYTFFTWFYLSGLLLSVAALTGVSLYRQYLPALLAALLSAWLLSLFLRQIRFPIRQVNYFLSALHNRDLMMRFSQTRDPLLRQMNNDMNRIISLYWKEQNEIDTKKLYYERLLRIITHEIRNTITPIVSLSADMLTNQENYSMEKRHEEMEIIHEQTRNIIQFLNSYHQLTHLPQPVYNNIDVYSFLKKLLNLLDKERGRIVIHSSVAEQMGVNADANLITLVIINLMRNAIQALREQPDPQIEIVASKPGKQAVISITDNGPGIPEKLIESVFLPFFSTKKEGSGIGLCLSRQIMRLHNGDLTVSSIPYKRTTFSLVFPDNLF